jgi:hypothetical protein
MKVMTTDIVPDASPRRKPGRRQIPPIYAEWYFYAPLRYAETQKKQTQARTAAYIIQDDFSAVYMYMSCFFLSNNGQVQWKNIKNCVLECR